MSSREPVNSGAEPASDSALTAVFTGGKLYAKSPETVGDSAPATAVVGPDLGLLSAADHNQIVAGLSRRNDPGSICDALPWAAVVQRDARTAVACCSTTLTSGLFYAYVKRSENPARWCFATDPRSLLELRAQGHDLDYAWLADLLHGTADATSTPFVGVRRLPAGQSLVVRDDGSSQAVPWLTDCWAPEPDLSGEAARKEYLQAFDSVVAQLVAKSGPVTFQVSGGLDSTFVAASIARALPSGQEALGLVSSPIPGVACRDPRPIMDDAPYARLMGERYPNLRIETVVNTDRIAPLPTSRKLAQRTLWPVLPGGNLVWLDAMHSIAAERGSKLLFTGQAGNAGFSIGPPYAASRSNRQRFREVLRRFRNHEKPSTPTEAPSWYVARPDGSPPPDKNPGLAPDRPYQRFREHLSKYVSVQAGLPKVAAFDVPQADPFRSRAILDLAARLTPETWRHDGVHRGFARWAGEGRVPDQIRLRRARGAQAPDEWAWIYDRRPEYQQALALLEQQPQLAHHIDWPILHNQVDRWAWGDPDSPPRPQELVQATRLANFGNWCQIMEDVGSTR